jgi:hypothetical protein
MSEDGRSHGNLTTRDPRPASTLLTVQAVGLAALGAAYVGANVVAAAGLCLILAAVAGGLATSIAEGLPHSGPAVIGFEGATLALAASRVSLAAATAVLIATVAALRWRHHRHRDDGQIRRPVPCQ